MSFWFTGKNGVLYLLFKAPPLRALALSGDNHEEENNVGNRHPLMPAELLVDAPGIRIPVAPVTGEPDLPGDIRTVKENPGKSTKK